jgi:TonB family protein
MLDILVASHPPHTLRPRWLSGSLVVHLVLAAIAVEGSRVEAGPTGPVVADTTLLFLPRLAPPAVRTSDAPRPAGLGGSGRGMGNIVVSANPPPRGFQTVVPPGDIPTSIPPVDLTQAALDPRDYAGKGQEGGVAWGVTGGAGPVDQALIPPEVSAGEVVYTATLDDARFEPAQLISQPIPRYPRAMEAIAMSGRVLIQFIIDTAGAVELRSLQVLESTHEAFEEPARESVARAVFRPARLGVYPVRQLTKQPISFVVRQ